MPTLIDSSSGNCSPSSGCCQNTQVQGENQTICRRVKPPEPISIRHHDSVLDGRMLRGGMEMTTHSLSNMKQVFVHEGCEYEWTSYGYFSFLFADSRINTGSKAQPILFFISSSFVPSRPSTLVSNPVLVRVKC